MVLSHNRSSLGKVFFPVRPPISSYSLDEGWTVQVEVDINDLGKQSAWVEMIFLTIFDLQTMRVRKSTLDFFYFAFSFP